MSTKLITKTIRLPEDVVNALTKDAEQMGISFNALVSVIIYRALGRG